MSNFQQIEENLISILEELLAQPEVADQFPSGILGYGDSMEQLREFIVDAGEYGIAYESIVAMLESLPFHLSGLASVKLLEVGLLMGFKTDRPQDARFDRR